MQTEDVPLTLWLQRAARGERDALDRVFAALYPDLRRIARARLRGRGDVASLDTTSLVHETFLRLVGVARLSLDDRRHFFAYAAKTMRNIVVEFARDRHAQRRGGAAAALQLDTALAGELAEAEAGAHASLLAVNDALLALEAVDPDLARVVEMRYFAGYTEEEVAELTGTSERTVSRQWEKARAFLLASLRG